MLYLPSTRMATLVLATFFVVQLFVSSSRSYEILVQDPGPIAMNSVQEVHMKIVVPYDELETWDKPNIVRLDFNLTDDKSWALDLLNNSLEFTYEDMLWSKEKSILVQAHVIGVDTMNITSVVLDPEQKIVSRNDTALSVSLSAILGDRTLNTLFTVIMMVMIIINTGNSIVFGWSLAYVNDIDFF